MLKKIEIDFYGRPLSVEVGRMAKQADGAALVRYGETVVLVTAVAAKELKADLDFFPLTVDYQEKTFAAGKIPGGFFKREGRPSEKEILTCRLIDRSIRPLFADGLRCETQIIATVLSTDKENDPDVVAMLGASVALEVSDIPFNGPLAGVRIGRVDGKWVINPTQTQLRESDVDIFLSGSRDAIVMVEGGARTLPEDLILEALFFGHDAIQTLLKYQEELKREVGKTKRPVPLVETDKTLGKRVEELAREKLLAAMAVAEKLERYKRLDEVKAELLTQALLEFPERKKEIKSAFGELKRNYFRRQIVMDRRRIDGRGLKDVRPITCEVEILPRTHGSALFTRGETQALVVTTLGTTSDEQKIDALMGEHYKKFMLHYNFPPFSVGEVKFLRGPGRREIGHGALAERALLSVIPPEEEFPYTVRIVSEVLESNGSTSMATVCGGSLSLMDAGVPITAPVAGIAMGLIREGEQVRILSDILGDEDHLGDMDFKVAGTREGVTALQMDIKISGVTREVMREALYQAREGRLHILDVMGGTIQEARRELSGHAPRIITLKVKPEKIREIIGPGGKVIRGIVQETGVKMDVEDDGTVMIASNDEAASRRAVEMVQRITAEAEIGKIYRGTVRKIMDFGAFVEILPGTDGLVHISQLAPERVHRVTDVLNEGDEVMVKVLEIDRQGKIKLSRKEAMAEGAKSPSSRSSRESDEPPSGR
ncbi:MAG: polyribonucleotide nucleotidyltransferase [Deltaproteobacteria bacterium RIFCSPLOWO2_12_FULL_60_19]|nr:MAG: polyribonucleotide nucleotidyltransferase [Deltaproteobacteria bacterium RIFCSPLOWO2_12_FULL_60_19]